MPLWMTVSDGVAVLMISQIIIKYPTSASLFKRPLGHKELPAAAGVKYPKQSPSFRVVDVRKHARTKNPLKQIIVYHQLKGILRYAIPTRMPLWMTVSDGVVVLMISQTIIKYQTSASLFKRPLGHKELPAAAGVKYPKQSPSFRVVDVRKHARTKNPLKQIIVYHQLNQILRCTNPTHVPLRMTLTLAEEIDFTKPKL